jgi:hypothetical protein
MPETATILDTPATVARAVLDNIERNPATFDMNHWYESRNEGVLTPADEPLCGTTMCIAGWVAHLTGWSLYPGDHLATRDGDEREIKDIAAEALNVPAHDNETDGPGLFYETNEHAVTLLRTIAES